MTIGHDDQDDDDHSNVNEDGNEDDQADDDDSNVNEDGLLMLSHRCAP